MRNWFLLIIVAALPALAQNGEQLDQLFNGKDLDGWKFEPRVPGRQGFTVEDGVLRTQPGSGLLWYTRKKIGNATLRVVYKMSNEKATRESLFAFRLSRLLKASPSTKASKCRSTIATTTGTAPACSIP